MTGSEQQQKECSSECGDFKNAVVQEKELTEHRNIVSQQPLTICIILYFFIFHYILWTFEEYS
jgi:hypothetical protein